MGVEQGGVAGACGLEEASGALPEGRRLQPYLVRVWVKEGDEGEE